MANDTIPSVNSCITDAVTQANVQVLASAPSMAMGNLYLTLSNSMAMAAANAVTAQHQANMLHQTATIKGVALLLS